MQINDKALEIFTEYFVKNYPGPDTIIHDPKWHAPRIFRVALHALTSATPPDVAGAMQRLGENLASFDAEVASELLSEGERADLWTEIDVNVDDLRAVLTALRLSAGGGWMPIESAPKDGTKILVWADGYEWPEVIYFEQYDAETADEVGEPGYWRYADDLLADVAEIEFDTLSHWQPLPASPTVEAGHVE